MDSVTESVEDSAAELAYKIVVLGKSGVGKTSILLRYSSNSFSETTVMTVGAGYARCEVDLCPDVVVLNVWDTAGQERFESLIPLYVRSAQGCILVFDASSPCDVKAMEKLYEQLTDNMYVSLCGNKIDLVEDFDSSRAMMKWARHKGIKYFKTSAKTGEGVEDVFTDMAATLKERERFIDIPGEYISNGRNNVRSNCC